MVALEERNTMAQIGILTHCPGRNYGGSLQCYALQRVLKGMGHHVEVVDFRPPKVLYGMQGRRRGLVSRLVDKACGLACAATVDRVRDGARERLYRKFYENDIPLTAKTFHDGAELAAAPPGFDAYVVGSDVVWSPGEDLTFFLPFVPPGTRRVSYAASFGTESVPEHLAERIGGAIREFDSISVREQRGVELVGELAGREARLVLDPALLLEAGEWAEFGSESGAGGAYAMSYFLNESPAMRGVSAQVSQALGLRNVSVAGGNLEWQTSRRKLKEYARNLTDRRVTSRYDLGPREFVALVRDCEVLVTNSFHGMAFAALFRKPFVAVLRKGLSVRQRHFARMLGLEDCLVSEPEGFAFDGLPEIDFDEVHRRLASLREDSKAFLQSALS